MKWSFDRVLVAGTWDVGVGYPRTRALVAALRHAGVTVEELRVPLPDLGVSKSKLLRSPWLWPRFAIAMWRARRELVRRVRIAVTMFRPDVVVVPYPGHLAVRWLRGVVPVPLVLDLFLSAHSTAVEDRGLFPRGSLPARALAAVDRRACEAADLVLLDTPQHAHYVQELTECSAHKLDWVPVADPEPPEDPTPLTQRSAGTPLELLFFGTGVALHGLRTLCDAVAECASVRLTLVGGSAGEREHARERIPAERLVLGGDFEPPQSLRQRIEDSDLVAGIFGASHKASIVVPFKLVHALAAARPVLTGDTAAVRGLLRPGVDCLVCPRDDAAALAKRLAELAGDPATLREVAAAGRSTFDTVFSIEATSERLCAALERGCATGEGGRRE